MPQGLLPFKYENETTSSGMTALAGLPVYLEILHAMRFGDCIDRNIKVRTGGQGWTDRQMIVSLILLNLAGGDCVEDLRTLEADEGFCRILAMAESCGLKRKQRREMKRRWRKGRKRSVPSSSAVFRYLEAFHNPTWDEKQVQGHSWIPHNLGQLSGFAHMASHMLAFAQSNDKQKIATLDMDATLIETHKKDALWSYKDFKAYQAFNVWWAEHGMFVHTEFRAGNTAPGFEQKRMLEKSLKSLPEGVETVRLRSDTAGYQFELLNYCELGENERFRRIEFAVGCPVTSAFRKAVAKVPESAWKPLHRIVNNRKVATGKEWAEVCYVTDGAGVSKKSPIYRYVATRERFVEQATLPDIELSKKKDEEAPSNRTVDMKSGRYRVFGLVSNMDWAGDDLLRWSYLRCGKSEHAHSGLKEDLAGGKLPSSRFGANAAWWWVSVLAFNLNVIMKSQTLDAEWKSKRMKAIRFNIINIPGRILRRSRQWFIRLGQDHPATELLIEIRRRIAHMQPAPT